MNSAFQIFVCLVACSGCVEHNATSVVLAAGLPPGPNLLQLRANPNAETEAGLPHGAFTSEVTLVRADATATCFDLMLRGGWQPTADVALEVDGAPAHLRNVALAECRVDAPFLPSDSHLARYPSDTNPRVAPRATRICFDGVPIARQALTLRLRQGPFERQLEFDVNGRADAR